jgi:hypothetical protein
MPTSSLGRKTLPLLLIVVLAAPWASAAGPRRPAATKAVASSAPFDLLGRSWAFLKSLWSEEGCMLDPDGRCLAGRPQALVMDSGCWLDPDGRCFVTTQAPVTDTGCRLDPDGRCAM